MEPGFYWFDPNKYPSALAECGFKKRTLVFVESSYDCLVDGRLSNWVDFRPVRENGRLGRRFGTYLGDQFTPAPYEIKAAEKRRK